MGGGGGGRGATLDRGRRDRMMLPRTESKTSAHGELVYVLQPPLALTIMTTTNDE